MKDQSVRDRQDTFLRLFEPHRDTLWRFVRSMVRSQHDAQDMMSETILQAYQGFHRIRDQQAFVAFLFTIARRIVQRHNWRRRFVGAYDEETVLLIPTTDMSPDETVDVGILHQALEKLPDKTREAVILYEILGFSIEEVRSIQGGTLSGVKSRLRRGRAALGVILGMRDSSKETSSSTNQHSFTKHPIL